MCSARRDCVLSTETARLAKNPSPDTALPELVPELAAEVGAPRRADDRDDSRDATDREQHAAQGRHEAAAERYAHETDEEPDQGDPARHDFTGGRDRPVFERALFATPLELDLKRVIDVLL